MELELVPFVEPPPLSSQLPGEAIERKKTSPKVAKVEVADYFPLEESTAPRVDFEAVVFP